MIFDKIIEIGGNVLMAVGVIAYFVYGFYCMLAVHDGIVYYTGLGDSFIGSWFAWFLAFIMGYTPGIGSVLGVLGAHLAWDWGLLQSIALFFWPFLLGFLISLLGLIVSAFTSIFK